MDYLDQPFIKFVYNQKRIFMQSNSIPLLDFIRTQFMIDNEKRKYIVNKKYIPEKLCPISELYSFMPGLFYDIVESIKKNFPDVKIIWNDIKHVVQPSPISNVSLIQPENTKFIYRDYQEDVIHKGLLYGRGCFDMATASGKSLMIYGLIKNSIQYRNFKSFMIVVPNIQLVHQFEKDIREYGFTGSICKYSADCETFYQNEDIIITNIQFLVRQPIVQSMDCIILDEVHGFSNQNKIYHVIDRMHCHSIYGFTGSMPAENELEKLWHLKGLTGKILQIKKSKEFQTKGILPKCQLTVFELEHTCPQPPVDHKYNIKVYEMNEQYQKEKTEKNELLLIDAKKERAKARFPAEWHFIEQHQKTNQIIAYVCHKLEGNVILLFDHIEHGTYLFEQITQKNDKNKLLYYIDGKIDVELREDARQLIENNDNCIIVANTKCFSVGINMKNIEHIVFAFSSGKAAAKILQSIGRGLRPKDGKDFIKIYDFYHNFKYSTAHYEERKELYNQNYIIDKQVNKTIKVD